jgi:hypothetical protein
MTSFKQILLNSILILYGALLPALVASAPLVPEPGARQCFAHAVYEYVHKPPKAGPGAGSMPNIGEWNLVKQCASNQR